MDPQTLIPERTLAGYTLVREAGRGAMSTVYEARDPNGRLVALKVLHTPVSLPPDQQRSLIERLGREARVMASLSHPNVVQIYDVGQAGGEHFLVMEFLDGQTLRQRLDGGSLSLLEATRILDGVAEALDAVHAQGVVHRDIKPSNVMLLPDGRVKLMDFGVARQGDDTTITQTGMIVGSPAYMSPEQVRGEENTPATDLWALGILLYEMLAGRSPFTGSNVSTVLYRVAHDQPAPVPGVAPDVQHILRRALDKNPARRYPTGCALAEAFQDVVQPAGRARPARGAAWSAPRLRPWQVVAVPVALLLALLVGSVFLTRSHRTAPTPFHGRLASVPPTSPPVTEVPPSHVQINEVTPKAHPSKAVIPRVKSSVKRPKTRAAVKRRLPPNTPAYKAHLKRLAHKKLAAAHRRARLAHRTAAYRHRSAPRRHNRRGGRILYYRPSTPASSQRLEQLHHFIYSGGYNY